MSRDKNVFTEHPVSIGARRTPRDGDDRYQVTLMLENIYLENDKQVSVEKRLRRSTHTLVQRHSTKITAVAEALLNHQHLAPEEIDALAGMHLPDIPEHLFLSAHEALAERDGLFDLAREGCTICKTRGLHIRLTGG